MENKVLGRKSKGGKSSDSRRFYEPHTALGCLWRSVVFTLALFLLYIIVGWIIAG